MASRELVPLRRLIAELHKHGMISTPMDHPFSVTHPSTFEASTVYKDSASCIVLAHSEGTKVRIKHISLKWHRFKDRVRAGDIKVVKIDRLGRHFHQTFLQTQTRVSSPFHYGLVMLSFFCSSTLSRPTREVYWSILLEWTL
jgi:hypothetical protein